VSMDAVSGPVLAMSREMADKLLEDSTNKAHEGRAYDYYLGGNSNYAADRAFALRQIARVPDLPWAARQNRRFLGRAIQHMINQGIRQFVDIGSGLPTEGNVHQVAQRYAPEECRVVYVDHDPVASAHGYLVLERSDQLERNRPINGDLQNYEQLWEGILDTGLIDPAQPVGLLLVAVLHFIPDAEDPHTAVAFCRDLLASGSHLAISHASTDGMPQEAIEALLAVLKDYDQATSPARSRTREQVKEFFGDWALLEPPGIVWTPEWTTEDVEEDSIVGDMDAYRSQIVAGMARKP
jgi:O-methyltransferase involved in polyketide biosynthesis